MKSRLIFQPFADDSCFEILGVIEKKDDSWGLAVGCHNRFKILDDARRVAVFFSRYVNESMGVRIVSSQNIEPLTASIGFEDRRRFGVSPT